MTSGRHNFIVFSDDWGRHPSSCQHLFAELARRHRVLWVNTLGLRAARADSFTVARAVDKFLQWGRPLRRVGDDFFVYSPPMLPTAGGLAGRLNSGLVVRQLRHVLRRCGMDSPVLVASVPTAADYVGQLGERAVAYYITDDYRQWPGANAQVIARQDELLTRRADLLLPVSQALAEGRRTSARIEMLPHGVDLAHFARVDGPLAEPADLAGIGRPRLCFFGLVYEKIDLELFRRLAQQDRSAHLVLIGPVKTDVSALAREPNMHLLGAKPYQDLPGYLKYMDVLLLAYVLDEQTLRCGPLKIRECLAVGKPIVAVDVPDLRRFGGLIRLAGSAEEYLAACQAACRNGHVSAAQMRASVAGDTWAARAQQLERALAAVLADRAPRLGPSAVQVAACTDGAAWDAYVAGHPAGCVWHRWGWRRVMRACYDLQCHYLVARRGGRVAGVLPLALQASPFFGRHLMSLPWLDHAGILADDANAREALLAAAQGLADGLKADLTLRELSPANAPHTRTDKLAMTLALPETADAMWKQLKAKVRNQVRKAEKAGMAAHWAGPEMLGEFYRVYLTNMRDLGSPPHSMEFFQEVFRQFADVARLVLVRLADKTVAAALVLTDRAIWQVPWASSLRRFNHLCPNHALYWGILANACGQARDFCFGRSSRDSGTFDFKAQWGARPVQLYWHAWLGGPPRGDGRPSRLVGAVRRLWQRMPVSLARSLGPHVIRCVG